MRCSGKFIDCKVALGPHSGVVSAGSSRRPIILNGLTLTGAIRTLDPPTPVDLNEVQKMFLQLVWKYGQPDYEADKKFYDREMRRIAEQLIKKRPSIDIEVLPFGITREDFAFRRLTYQKTSDAQTGRK